MLRVFLCSKMRFIAQFQLCNGHLNFRNRLSCRPVNVKLCQPLVLQLKGFICTNIFQSLLDLLLLDLAALYDTDGFCIRAAVNLRPTQNIAFISVLDFNICHHRVFAAIAARENTRCCHSQSHHTSALQEITTSHISHFLAPRKLFCFFLFSFARLRKRRLVCHN